jgi:hypothetical protein
MRHKAYYIRVLEVISWDFARIVADPRLEILIGLCHTSIFNRWHAGWEGERVQKNGRFPARLLLTVSMA